MDCYDSDVEVFGTDENGVEYLAVGSYSCDELVDSLEEYFIGQIGMRIMQRPQGNAKFKTKEELNEFMNMLFIENVWCFYSVDSCISNHTGHSYLDLFRHSRTTTLDNFFE